MGTTYQEKFAKLAPDHQAEITAEAARLREEYLTLQELRKARELTQEQLAETLGQKQGSIAKLEQRTDLLLSTLRRYVEAMGGTLDLIVQFPDRNPVFLSGLSDEEPDHSPQNRRKKPSVEPHSSPT